MNSENKEAPGERTGADESSKFFDLQTAEPTRGLPGSFTPRLTFELVCFQSQERSEEEEMRRNLRQPQLEVTNKLEVTNRMVSLAFASCFYLESLSDSHNVCRYTEH